MCLWNLQTQFGVWDLNRSWDSDLPTPKYIFLPWPCCWALSVCLQVCQHLPLIQKCFYVSQEHPKKILMQRALIKAEILTFPIPQCIGSTWPGFWVPVLCPQACQHLLIDLPMFLCVSDTSKKYLVHEVLIEAEILTSPSPIYLLNLSQVLGTGTLLTHVSTPLKLSRNVSRCLRNMQKIFCP